MLLKLQYLLQDRFKIYEITSKKSLSSGFPMVTRMHPNFPLSMSGTRENQALN
jgi:hypothetical protein